MVLNLFTGGALFNTSNEERWKGVFDNRQSPIPSAASSQASINSIGLTWTNTTASVILEVKPDEKVVVLACATANSPANSIEHMRVLRSSTTIGLEPRLGNSSDMFSSLAVTWIDNPGEGFHTYIVQGKTTNAPAAMEQIMLSCFVISVR